MIQAGALRLHGSQDSAPAASLKFSHREATEIGGWAREYPDALHSSGLSCEGERSAGFQGRTVRAWHLRSSTATTPHLWPLCQSLSPAGLLKGAHCAGPTPQTLRPKFFTLTSQSPPPSPLFQSYSLNCPGHGTFASQQKLTFLDTSLSALFRVVK